MTVPVIAFFNNKGGVGKTSLVYHLAWMYTKLGLKVVAADLDPQANLTAAFLDESDLEALWQESGGVNTIYDAIKPLSTGEGDIASEPALTEIADRLYLIAGDLALARFEDELSQEWPRCLDGQPRSFRVISAFWRVIQQAATAVGGDVVLADLGPNLGAINRASLIASDFMVVPLAPDLFSLQGLKNLGPSVREWRRGWQKRLEQKGDLDLAMPRGRIEPAGYVVMQHAIRLDRPVKAYEQWVKRIPKVYAEHVLDQPLEREIGFADDPGCLALLKHYRSLMPMAQEARKPMFDLTYADGAIGAHFTATREVRKDFRSLAERIAARCMPEIEIDAATTRGG